MRADQTSNVLPLLTRRFPRHASRTARTASEVRGMLAHPARRCQQRTHLGSEVGLTASQTPAQLAAGAAPRRTPCTRDHGHLTTLEGCCRCSPSDRGAGSARRATRVKHARGKGALSQLDATIRRRSRGFRASMRPWSSGRPAMVRLAGSVQGVVLQVTICTRALPGCAGAGRGARRAGRSSRKAGSRCARSASVEGSVRAGCSVCR